MKTQFRVKAFVFVNANSSKEAEEIAAGAVGARPWVNNGPEIEQVVIRAGGTKEVVVKEARDE